MHRTPLHKFSANQLLTAPSSSPQCQSKPHITPKPASLEPPTPVSLLPASTSTYQAPSSPTRASSSLKRKALSPFPETQAEDTEDLEDKENVSIASSAVHKLIFSRPTDSSTTLATPTPRRPLGVRMDAVGETYMQIPSPSPSPVKRTRLDQTPGFDVLEDPPAVREALDQPLEDEDDVEVVPDSQESELPVLRQTTELYEDGDEVGSGSTCSQCCEEEETRIPCSQEEPAYLRRTKVEEEEECSLMPLARQAVSRMETQEAQKQSVPKTPEEMATTLRLKLRMALYKMFTDQTHIATKDLRDPSPAQILQYKCRFESSAKRFRTHQ
ncbi:hypothetical protein BJ508DRAFT_414339 [Ascobolus immersus RN42]|uniref:Uncharacterized protein n=1 Tax=Ascobolus immersus RN42 TaxID=1160509 RepID=A0A3N4I9D7_ASCIM|nr:hypothetical protein BJ508DRAFT_414339 [Ascobolus immersus RN42]